MWPCGLTIVGITVLPARSTRRSPSPGRTSDPAATTRPSRTRIPAPITGSLPLPTMSRAPSKKVVRPSRGPSLGIIVILFLVSLLSDVVTGVLPPMPSVVEEAVLLGLLPRGRNAEEVVVGADARDTAP